MGQPMYDADPVLGPSRYSVVPMLLLLACKNSTEPPPEPLEAPPPKEPAKQTEPEDTPGLSVPTAWIDRAHAPRADAPLIAGESVLIGASVFRGTPPYQVRVRVTSTESGVSALDAQKTVEDPLPDVHLGLESMLAAGVPGGTYKLFVEVTDASGATATSPDAVFQLIGSDAEQLPPPKSARYIDVLDVAKRRRRVFARGEELRVRIRLPATEATCKNATLRVVHESRRPVVDANITECNERLEVLMRVPRLARAGTHYVEFAADGGKPLRTHFGVLGPAFPATKELQVDKLYLYGGKTRREPRQAVVYYKEPLLVEARVGGGKKQVSCTLRLWRDEKLWREQHFPPTAINASGASRRTFVCGKMRLPEFVPPGTYMLEIDTREDLKVSTLHREIRVR